MEAWAGIVAFARTAQLRSFSAAARGLGISGSAVAKSVARLEASLGVRLLNRTTRSVSLTDEGAAFLEHAQRALAEVEDAVAAVGASRAEPRGTLRVDVPVVLGRERVLPLVARLLAQHPHLAVDMRFSDRWTPLVEEAVDVVVRVGPIADSRLVARRLGSQHLVLVAAPEYLRRRGVPRRPSDLDAHDCVLFRLPTTGRARPLQFRDGRRTVELRPKSRVLLDEGEAVARAAAAGLGVAQVPTYLAERELADGRLTTLLDACAPEPAPVSIAWLANRQLAPKVRAFADLLLAHRDALLPPWTPPARGAGRARSPARPPRRGHIPG